MFSCSSFLQTHDEDVRAGRGNGAKLSLFYLVRHVNSCVNHPLFRGFNHLMSEASVSLLFLYSLLVSRPSSPVSHLLRLLFFFSFSFSFFSSYLCLDPASFPFDDNDVKLATRSLNPFGVKIRDKVND